MKKMNSILVATIIVATITSCEGAKKTEAQASEVKTSVIENNAESKTTMSKVDKATAVLQSFQSGDATAMNKYVNQDKYIQHNHAFPNGIAPVVGAVESGAFKGTLVNTHRTISDGNFVVLQSLYSGSWNNKSPLVVIDVFRFENDLIVEHWDNMMPLASKPNPSGNTQLDGTTRLCCMNKSSKKKHSYRFKPPFYKQAYQGLSLYLSMLLLLQLHFAGFRTDGSIAVGQILS